MTTAEIEVLQSIYPELVVGEDGRQLSIHVQVAFERSIEVTFATSPACDVSFLPPLQVTVDVPAGYPDAGPPVCRLDCGWLRHEKLADLQRQLAGLWRPGEEVLYGIVDHLYAAAESAFDQVHVDEVGRSTIRLEDGLRPVVLAHQAKAARVEFEKLSYECEICLDWKAGPACVSLFCGHVFCKDCLRDMFSLHIKEGSVGSIRCPSCPVTGTGRGAEVSAPDEASQRDARDSMRHMPLEVLQSIVTREEAVRYQKLLRKQELEAMNSTYCPREFCGTTLPRDPDEKLVVCSECSYAFCADCRKTWHGPTEPCRRLRFSSTLGELYLSLQADAGKGRELESLERLYGAKNLQRLVRELEDERLADAWRRENAQACPVCAVSVEKSMGCNHMICGVCKTHFCFLCGEGLSARNPYSHYSDKGLSCYGKLFEGLTGLEDPYGLM